MTALTRSRHAHQRPGQHTTLADVTQTYLAFWELTGELRNRGTATVVISHLVFERERFDRICYLSGGRIHEEASSHAATA